MIDSGRRGGEVREYCNGILLIQKVNIVMPKLVVVVEITSLAEITILITVILLPNGNIWQYLSIQLISPFQCISSSSFPFFEWGGPKMGRGNISGCNWFPYCSASHPPIGDSFRRPLTSLPRPRQFSSSWLRPRRVSHGERSNIN